MTRKIFNISLHRSATQSFHDFCQRAGLRSVHWAGFDFDHACEPALVELDYEYVWSLYRDVIDANDAFNDLPTAFLWRQAFRDFPDAHFIVMLRSPDAWIRSIRRHTSDRPIDVLEKMQYWGILAERRPHISDYPDGMLRDGYIRHYVSMSEAALRMGIPLATFWLEDPQLERKLKLSLGFESPSLLFSNVDVNRLYYV